MACLPKLILKSSRTELLKTWLYPLYSQTVTCRLSVLSWLVVRMVPACYLHLLGCAVSVESFQSLGASMWMVFCILGSSSRPHWAMALLLAVGFSTGDGVVVLTPASDTGFESCFGWIISAELRTLLVQGHIYKHMLNRRHSREG